MSLKLVYHGLVNPAGVRNVEALCTKAVNEHADLTLCICSNGGDVASGVGLYNFLRMLPIAVNVHCFGVCASIAVTIFLAGKNRTTSPVSRFNLHAASVNEGPRKGEISENTALISMPFKRELNWGEDQIEHFFGSQAEKIFPPEEALKLGIVHTIQDIKFDAADQIINVAIP